MITSLDISGFRSFKKLRIGGLTRVNLFVGRNNAGKTSVLEAAEIFSIGTPEGLLRSPIRRRERILISREEPGFHSEVDLSHLFYGHNLNEEATFRIEGLGGKTDWLECEVVRVNPYELSDSRQRSLLPDLAGAVTAIRVQSSSGKSTLLQLSPFGGLTESSQRVLAGDTTKEAAVPVNFLGTEQIENFRLSQLWDNIVLTPAEFEVTAALRLIEPRAERIAFLGTGRAYRTTVIKLQGEEHRLPLGSAGDGLKRLFYLTLNLLSSRNGFLLVDEIDTGLHYTVMADMWRLVIETAKRLDVQVFATSHSQDCVRALAWVRESNPDLAPEVTLHRIEKASKETVTYSLDELAIAARHHVEVR